MRRRGKGAWNIGMDETVGIALRARARTSGEDANASAAPHRTARAAGVFFSRRQEA